MLGFNSKKDDLLGLHQKIGRFLNDTQYVRIEEEKQRAESRTRVGLPCLLFLFSEADAPSNYAVGITTDISLHGLGMIVHEKLEVDDYILVFGPPESRLYVKGHCRRASPTHFGTYAHAFEFIKMLRASEYPIVEKAVETLDQTSCTIPPPSVPAPSKRRSGLLSTMWHSIAR